MSRVLRGINVLSFFDGISAGQEALRQLGVQIDNYYAIEIDSEAIKVTQYNFSDTKQVGDILRFDKAERKFVNSLPVIDLVFAGSPCQGFSKSGKGMGLKDPRSKLFFNFYRIWKKINQKRSKEGLPPVPFFFENVVMHKDFAQQITNHLGVDYYAIDAIDYSPCARSRYYWTNLNIPETILSKYRSNSTYSTVFRNEMFPDRFSRSNEATIVYRKNSSANSLCAIDPKDQGRQGYRVFRYDRKMQTFLTSGKGLEYGLGLYAVPASVTPFSAPLTITVPKDIVKRLHLKGSSFKVVHPTITEASSAMGFHPMYLGNPDIKDNLSEYKKCVHALGNSWSVIVVKLLIESYCTRMGWIR